MRIATKIIIILLLLVSYSEAFASGKFTRHISTDRKSYNYIMYSPDSLKEQMPLIVALHSRASAGTNLDDVDHFGTIDALQSGMELNAIVIAPQTTGERWDPEMVWHTVSRARAICDIDSNRIYAIGMSMGGNGVADLAASYPDKIAAVVVLAGIPSVEKFDAFGQVPAWLIRGKNDRPEAVARTEYVVNCIKAANPDSTKLRYSKVKGVDHRAHERMLYMSCLYEWLLSHDLQELGRPVHKTAEIKSSMLKNVYKDLNIRPSSATLRKSNRPRHRSR